MATLAAVLDPAAPMPYKQGREFVQRVLITASGNYTTGGDTLNLAGLQTPGINSPFEWYFWGSVGAGLSYDYVPGTNRSDGKLMGFSGATQFTGGAGYPTDTIHGEFRYKTQT